MNFQNMFEGASAFNGDVTAWNVSGVYSGFGSMYSMFAYASAFNRDIRSWRVPANVGTSSMFTGTRFVQSFKCPGTVHGPPSACYVTSFSSPYRLEQAVAACFAEAIDGDCQCASGCGEAGLPISSWNTTGMIYMQYLFENREWFNQDLSKWDTSSVTNMKSMFRNAKAFNRDLSAWNVGNVADMTNMFSGAWSFDRNLSTWSIKEDAKMNGMFEDAVAFLLKYACATPTDGPPSSCSQASPWASTLKHWFDFSSSAHVSANSEGAVTSFSDKMGNAASLVVHGSPAYVDMSRQSFNSFINFTQDGDRLAFDALGGSNPEVFIAYNVLQYFARGSLFGDANNGYGFGLLDGASGDDIVAMGSSSGPILAQVQGATFGLWHVAHLNFDATNAFMKIDGNATASFDGITGRYTATSLSAGLIGGVPFANHFAPNYFGEVMVFDSPLNQTMRDVITQYLASKWKANATDWYSLED